MQYPATKFRGKNLKNSVNHLQNFYWVGTSYKSLNVYVLPLSETRSKRDPIKLEIFFDTKDLTSLNTVCMENISFLAHFT